MSIKKSLKFIFVSGAALLMFASAGDSVNDVNVSARHVRTHRTYRSHKYNVKKWKHSRNVHKAHVRRYQHRRNGHKVNRRRANHKKNVHKVNVHRWNHRRNTRRAKHYGRKHFRTNRTSRRNPKVNVAAAPSQLTSPSVSNLQPMNNSNSNQTYEMSYGKYDLGSTNNYNVYQRVMKTLTQAGTVPQTHRGLSLLGAERDVGNKVITDPNVNLELLQKESLKDLNQDRIKNHLAPFAQSNILTTIANVRAQQLQNNFAYQAPDASYLYSDSVGALLGYNPSKYDEMYDENIAESKLGTMQLPNEPQYTNNNGQRMADHINDVLVNHSNNLDYMSRFTVNDPDYHYVGISVSFDGQSQYPYRLAEEFY